MKLLPSLLMLLPIVQETMGIPFPTPGPHVIPPGAIRISRRKATSSCVPRPGNSTLPGNNTLPDLDQSHNHKFNDTDTDKDGDKDNGDKDRPNKCKNRKKNRKGRKKWDHDYWTDPEDDDDDDEDCYDDGQWDGDNGDWDDDKDDNGDKDGDKDKDNGHNGAGNQDGSDNHNGGNATDSGGNNGQWNGTEHGGNNGQWNETDPGGNNGQWNQTDPGGNNGQWNETEHGGNNGQWNETEHGGNNGQWNQTDHGGNNGQWNETEHGGNNGQWNNTDHGGQDNNNHGTGDGDGDGDEDQDGDGDKDNNQGNNSGNGNNQGSHNNGTGSTAWVDPYNPSDWVPDDVRHINDEIPAAYNQALRYVPRQNDYASSGPDWLKLAKPNALGTYASLNTRRGGQATFYSLANPDENHGYDKTACGIDNPPDTYPLVALPMVNWNELWSGDSWDAPFCGHLVRVRYGNRSATAQVLDGCAPCGYNSIDMSPVLFYYLTDGKEKGDKLGILSQEDGFSWEWLDDPSTQKQEMPSDGYIYDGSVPVGSDSGYYDENGNAQDINDVWGDWD
ncbi:hypothetical protein A1Q1_01882 [Trichosporon asahii var. asahii CBS 2479]|uniref:Expansin family protein n=1 Tax=Trichosporon asahii var. asahii (strain ATCC 90039 / CBS 2479 / JCM 2466 / KCTC 7840 / NBRC 103889/ NCYC 2677 / UAMH 7654) TaxID=1186058 RepID=J5T449_TRIAS|nr:hypothetical protein A1Q1_01882 [Trichosporon asahii var. asahii CBS 2479]EJT49051.1 hypothetical protein A1Q1_01882 [Trichosporon asahii var. asahii CBS 2479]